MMIPYSFIRDINSTLHSYPKPGKLVAHEFIKLRFGIFDEKGFSGDKLYPAYYKSDGQILPTGQTNVPVKGVWVTKNGASSCQPDVEACIFQPQGLNDQVTCSLGFLPAIPSVTSYCKTAKGVATLAPTKHNVICDGRSTLDIIENSVDYALTNATKNVNFETRINPQIVVVQEKVPKIALVLEVSQSMAADEDWKFINKATQKLIRYDLPDSTQLAVVTFSNRSQVEAPITLVKGSRGHLADIIPDKYRLNADDERCVLCGVKTVMERVLGDHKEGAHIIIVTRGSNDTLNNSDQSTLREYAEYYQVSLNIKILMYFISDSFRLKSQRLQFSERIEIIYLYMMIWLSYLEARQLWLAVTL